MESSQVGAGQATLPLKGTGTMNPPRVSVLMAAYNTAAYLEEAVSSVLAQTLADFELIVIDDGSNDATPEILADLASRDSRIVIHRQENQGIGGATNTGLALARAEYVAILDSDDAMEPERLAIQADYLDRHAAIAAVGSQWYTMDTKSRVKGIDRHPLAADTVKSYMFAYFSMHHPTIMARKSIVVACGAYDKENRQGCRDYEVFANLLLAGHALANIPFLLTRWRLNPAGVTHSKARFQTEDCVEIRAHAFGRLAKAHPESATDIAKILIRTFPEGSWFDAKVASLIPDAAPSPALSRWRTLAAQKEIPALEALAVEWLTDEALHAEALARELEIAALPWLSELVRARDGGELPQYVRLGIDIPQARLAECSLSLLIPTRNGDDDLPQRIKSALTCLPDDAELLVFATDTTARLKLEFQEHGLPIDARLHFLPVPPTLADAWLAAVAAARGRHIAWLETGQRHHPEFLARAVTWLDTHSDDALVYGPADLLFADALDAQGRPVKDPAPEPRWCQETLLGRDCASLGAMVHRREAITRLPLDLRQTGEVTGWALARYLLVRHRPTLLDLRNIEFAPPIRPGDNIMAALIRRLIRWYLDTGLGCVPAAYAWRDMAPASARKRLQNMAAARAAGELAIHPGNTHQLLGFILRFSALPAADSIFRTIMRCNRPTALAALRKNRPIQLPLALAWWAVDKLQRKWPR